MEKLREMVVKWSKSATEDFNDTVRYLEKNWSKKVVDKFVRSIRKEVSQLAIFPFAFPVTNQRKDVRRCVVSKINSIYYSIENDIVLILAIIDNRQSFSPYT
jgi:plasmid stabilization system protein ParE